MEEVEVCYTLGRGGLRVPKSHALVEFYGSVDEAMAMIGLARAFLRDAELQEELRRIQLILYRAAASMYVGRSLLTEDDSSFLESLLRKYESRRPRGFIAPSGPPEVAALHAGRAAVRRAERVLCGIILGSQEDWMIKLGEVLNMMSQALYDMALEACTRNRDCRLESLG
ncbi:MAG: ATP:cob(I)alamin adenosyltransferase [Acidilobaceae archaeon]